MEQWLRSSLTAPRCSGKTFGSAKKIKKIKTHSAYYIWKLVEKVFIYVLLVRNITVYETLIKTFPKTDKVSFCTVSTACGKFLSDINLLCLV